NREVKNILGALGLEVNRLIRISYGPFQLGDLPEGQVIEVRGRTLRDQLGPRLIEDAHANFDAPIYNEVAGEAPVEPDARAERSGDTRERSGWPTDKKRDDRRGGDVARADTRHGDRKPGGKPGKPAGGKSFGGRGRDEPGFDEDKPKKRPPMGTSRTANVWMAPGARPTTENKARKSSARADAERLVDKPKPQNDRPVIVKRAGDASDWIRADSPPEGRDEKGGDFGRKRSFGDRPDRGGDRPARSGGERPFGDRPRGERSFSD